jgi:type IV secretion system protein VirD4
MHEATLSTSRKVVIGGLTVVSVTALTAGAAYLSLVFFRAGYKDFHNYPPHKVSPTELPAYWHHYQDDEPSRKRLLTAIGMSFGLAYVGLPVAYFTMRNPRNPNQFGEARFASAAEVMRSKLMGGKGVIIGRYKGEYLMLPDDMHVLAAAPSGSGKGTALVIPNLLHWPQSAVVLDPKGEAWAKTARYRKEHGQAVFKFDPFNERGCTHRWNPLAYVRDDELLRMSDLQQLSHMIWPVVDDAKGNTNFFNGKARDMFTTLGLYVMECEADGMLRTIGQMLRIASGDGRPLGEYFAALVTEREEQDKPLSFDCVAGFHRLLGNSDDTLNSIVNTFTEPLMAFADPIVDAATSGNDFDFDQLRRTRMSVYVVMPFHKLKAGKLLMNIFFTQLLNVNTQQELHASEDLQHEVLVMLDEFTAPGRLPIISEGAGFIRSYGLRLFLLFQSMDYLAAEYSVPIANSIAANHRCRIIFTPGPEDAKKVSEHLGTHEVTITNRSRSHGRSGAGTNDATSERSRHLMLAQELRMLDPEKEIILLEGHLPILCDKARYYKDPAMQRRIIEPALEAPSIDPQLHAARVRHLVRVLEPEERLNVTSLEQLDHDFSGLPKLDEHSGPAQISGFLDDFFVALGAIEPGANGEDNGEDNSIEPGPGGGAEEPEGLWAGEQVDLDTGEIIDVSGFAPIEEPVEDDSASAGMDLSVLLQHDSRHHFPPPPEPTAEVQP